MISSKEVNNKKRLKSVDIIRGIAIICIVLGHLGNKKINSIVFTFHVPIFYIITGYFIKEDENFNDFIKKKFKTLIIPYIFTCFIIIILAIIKGAITNGIIGAKNEFIYWLVASIYGSGDSALFPYPNAIGAIWFLLASFWGSIFLKLILHMKKIPQIMLVIILFLIGYYSRNIYWLPLSIQAGCCATFFIYIGYICKKYEKSIYKISDKVKSLLFIIALVIWIDFIKNFESFWLVHCDIGRGIIDLIGCLCGCYIIYLISKLTSNKFHILTKALSFLGQYSIFVLCIHIIEQNLMPWSDIIIKLGITDNNLKLLFLIIAKFILIIPITLLCSRTNFIRKIFSMKPVIKYN